MCKTQSKIHILVTKIYTTTSCLSWGIENSTRSGLHFHTEAPYSILYQNNLSPNFLKFPKPLHSTFILILLNIILLYILIHRESLHPNLPMTSYRSFGLLHLFGVQPSFVLQQPSVSLHSLAGTQFVQNSKRLNSRNNEGNSSTLVIEIHALHVYSDGKKIVQFPRKLYNTTLSEQRDER